MSWTLNGIKMYINDYGGSDPNTIARLQPLSGGTVKQFFGYEDEILKIGGIIVGSSDKASLKGYAKTHTAYTLVHADGTTLGNYHVKSFSWKQVPSVCQTMRPDLPINSPVYQMELELYIE